MQLLRGIDQAVIWTPRGWRSYSIADCVYLSVVQLPELSEIDTLLKGTKLNTIVFFLDETFDELR